MVVRMRRKRQCAHCFSKDKDNLQQSETSFVFRRLGTYLRAPDIITMGLDPNDDTLRLCNACALSSRNDPLLKNVPRVPRQQPRRRRPRVVAADGGGGTMAVTRARGGGMIASYPGSFIVPSVDIMGPVRKSARCAANRTKRAAAALAMVASKDQEEIRAVEAVMSLCSPSVSSSSSAASSTSSSMVLLPSAPDAHIISSVAETLSGALSPRGGQPAPVYYQQPRAPPAGPPQFFFNPIQPGNVPPPMHWAPSGRSPVPTTGGHHPGASGYMYIPAPFHPQMMAMPLVGGGRPMPLVRSGSPGRNNPSGTPSPLHPHPHHMLGGHLMATPIAPQFQQQHPQRLTLVPPVIMTGGSGAGTVGEQVVALNDVKPH